MNKTAGFFICCLLLLTTLHAQDTLPRFSVTARGPGRILISWHNRYPGVAQINIQRSADSLKNFTTLLAVPQPRLPENGATDSKAPHPNFYYRLFIVLDNGQYIFTPSRRPHSQSEEPVAAAAVPKDEDTEESIARAANTRLLVIAQSTEKTRIKTPTAIHSLPELTLSNTLFVRKGDTLLGQLSGPQVN